MIWIMNFNKILKRLIRGVCFLSKSLLIETPRGLDFSLWQKNFGISDTWNHGYALTQKKAFPLTNINIQECGEVTIDIKINH